MKKPNKISREVVQVIDTDNVRGLRAGDRYAVKKVFFMDGMSHARLIAKNGGTTIEQPFHLFRKVA